MKSIRMLQSQSYLSQINLNTSLLESVKSGNLNKVRVFLNRGADIEAKNKAAFTPFMLSLAMEQWEIANFLIEKGCNINARDSVVGYTAFMSYVSVKNLELMEWLYDKGADIELKNKDNSTPLTYSVKEGLLDIVTWLIQNGAHIDSSVCELSKNNFDINKNNTTEILCAINSAILSDYVIGNKNDFISLPDQEKPNLDFDLVKHRCKFLIKKIVRKTVNNDILENIESAPYLDSKCKSELISHYQSITFKSMSFVLKFYNLNNEKPNKTEPNNIADSKIIDNEEDAVLEIKDNNASINMLAKIPLDILQGSSGLVIMAELISSINNIELSEAMNLSGEIEDGLLNSLSSYCSIS